MNNKRHNILDDAWEMKEEDLGGAEHTMRIGLITNTVMNAVPIVIDSLLDLVIEKPEYNALELQKDLPVLLHVGHAGAQFAVLVVLDKDSGNIQCYPFNDLNDSKRWWAYELAFDLVPDGRVEIRPIHPMVADMDPTQEMIDHLESLVAIVTSFLHHLQAGTITVEEDVQDHSKINKKRIASNKAPIVNDWKLHYVSKQNS